MSRQPTRLLGRRLRAGFTLVEALVATAAASIVLVIMYTALQFYARAYTREDEVLERGRRGQEVLGLMRDDVERAQGEIQPTFIPKDGLKEVGCSDDPVGLLTKPHAGANVINAFANLQGQRPYLSKKYSVYEAWELAPGSGEPQVVRNLRQSHYLGGNPPQKILENIPPLCADACVVHIPVPYENTKSDYYIVRKVIGGVPTPVIWAFHRAKVDKWPAGSLLRWTAATGVQSVGGEQIEHLDVTPQYDWWYADPAPPKRPLPATGMNKMQVDVRLVFGKSKVQGGEPGFDMGAIFLVGP